MTFVNYICSQPNNNSTNSKNSKGQKTGLWIETNGQHKFVSYYLNGKENGVCYAYSNNKLLYFGEYINGKYAGNWYIFNNKQQLISKITIINADCKKVIVQKDMNKKVSYDVEAYITDYYPNLFIKAEGKVLFNNETEILIGEMLNYGIWKYYDEKGNCVNEIDETGVWNHS